MAQPLALQASKFSISSLSRAPDKSEEVACSLFPLACSLVKKAIAILSRERSLSILLSAKLIAKLFKDNDIVTLIAQLKLRHLFELLDQVGTNFRRHSQTRVTQVEQNILKPIASRV